MQNISDNVPHEDVNVAQETDIEKHIQILEKFNSVLNHNLMGFLIHFYWFLLFFGAEFHINGRS